MLGRNALRTASRRRAAVVLALVAASALGVAMVLTRRVATGEWEYRNLVWNLFLAWIPFVVAVALYDRHRRDASAVALLPLALVWVLFLPNAPYLVTDFFLLRYVDGVSVWLDIVLLATFAWTGLLLGFASLYLVHVVVARLAGAVAGWVVAFGALALSSFGIYLGRVLRWNSWDFFLQPVTLFADVWARVSDPLAHRQSVALTLALASFLIVAYAGVYTFLQFAVDEHERS